MNSNKDTGNWGEYKACCFLEDKGYKITARNFKSRFGEIDIICENKDYIVFTEVKLRKNSDFAFAREYVDYNKQRKIRMTASAWLARNETELQPRFDVIEIYAPEGIKGTVEINQIIDAF